MSYSSSYGGAASPGGSEYIDMESGLRTGMMSAPATPAAPNNQPESRSRRRIEPQPPLQHHSARRRPLDDDQDEHQRVHSSRDSLLTQLRNKIRRTPRRFAALATTVVIALYLLLSRRSDDIPFRHNHDPFSGADDANAAWTFDSNSTASSLPGPRRWNIPHPLLEQVEPLQKPSNEKQITIFATIRDLTLAYQKTNPVEYIKTWNALRSWRRLGNEGGSGSAGLFILLYVDHAEETCRHLKEDKLLDITRITCVQITCFSQEFKKPFMHCIWNDAVQRAQTEHLVFVNGDIVLLEDFQDAFQHLVAAQPRVVMVAQRTDVPAMDWPKSRLNYFIQLLEKDEEIDPTTGTLDSSNGNSGGLVYENPYHDPEWLTAFRSHVRTRGQLHADTGVDLFLFHRDLLSLVQPFPPFLVGVYRWDNWLLAAWLLRSGGSMYEGIHGIASSASTLRTSQEGFFAVVDATNSVTLVHDATRSDHLHNLGAAYNDELVRKNQGLLYKVGRIGNADLVLARRDESAGSEPATATIGEDTSLDAPPPLEPSTRTITSSGSLFLSWSTADRLDLHLSRAASPSASIGVLQASASQLPLLSNFLCWTMQRSFSPGSVSSGGHSHSWLILTDDLPTFKKTWEAGGIMPPVLLPPANYTLLVQQGVQEDDPAYQDTFHELSYTSRHILLSRILDFGFHPILVDLDVIPWESPFAFLEDLFHRYIHEEVLLTHPSTYTSQQNEGYPLNPTPCTVLGIQKEILTKPQQPGSNAPAGYETVFSTAFMRLHANKYSRFFLKKLSECTRNIFSHYPSVIKTDAKKRPCRYIEERCLADIFKSMRKDLSKEVLEDFKLCTIPQEFFLDHHSFQVGSRLSEATGSTRATVSKWTWMNDPSSSLPKLPAPDSSSATSPALAALQSQLPPLTEVFGESGGELLASSGSTSSSTYLFPKLLHDYSTSSSTVATPSFSSVPDKFSSWTAQGLYCPFRPDWLRRKADEAVLQTRAGPMIPLAPSLIAAGAAGSKVYGYAMRIHIHLSPSPRLTRSTLNAFLKELERADYPQQDSIDVEWDHASFYTPSELARDLRRRKLWALRRKNSGEAMGPEDEELLKAASPPTTGQDGLGGPDDGLPSEAPSDELDPTSDPNSWPLTLSEIQSLFRTWNWKFGMKTLLSTNIASVNPAYVEPIAGTPITAGTVGASKVSVTSAPTKTKSLAEDMAEQSKSEVFSLRVEQEEWLVHGFYKEPVSAASTTGPTSPPTSSASSPPAASKPGLNSDVPILLLHPFLHVHRQWYQVARAQLSRWTKRPDEPSCTERRWLGINMNPFLLRNGDQSSYPPSSSLFASEARPRLPLLKGTTSLRLLADSFTLLEGERRKEESLPAIDGLGGLGGNTTLSGRVQSSVYRTQLVNPVGLILFSSTIHHFNVWKKGQYAHAAEFAEKSPTDTGVTNHRAAPCWHRPDARTNLLHPAPAMSAFARFIYETGSFVTAPAPMDSGEFTSLVSERDIVSAAPIDIDRIRIPSMLSSVPLFDLTGASVPLPDTLSSRHIVLKAALSQAVAAVDGASACVWPPMHPKFAERFHIDLTPMET